MRPPRLMSEVSTRPAPPDGSTTVGSARGTSSRDTRLHAPSSKPSPTIGGEGLFSPSSRCASSTYVCPPHCERWQKTLSLGTGEGLGEGNLSLSTLDTSPSTLRFSLRRSSSAAAAARIETTHCGMWFRPVRLRRTTQPPWGQTGRPSGRPEEGLDGRKLALHQGKSEFSPPPASPCGRLPRGPRAHKCARRRSRAALG